METNSSVARAAAGAARAASTSPGMASTQPDPGRFDPAKLEKSSCLAAVINWAFSYPVSRWWMDPLRWLTPVICVPGVRGGRMVLRYDDVRDVLSHDREFPVPWGGKMVEVTGGEQAGGRNFVLGMARNETYRLSYAQLAEAFPLSDVKDHVIRLSRIAAEKIVAQVGQKDKPEFDAVEELVCAVPTELCESYYGIRIGDDDEKTDREKKSLFAKWTLAISSYLFGPPFDRPVGPASESEQLALAAAERLRDTIRASIEEAKAAKGNKRRGVVLPRMLDMGLDEDVIHAQLFGMVLGFIPTDVLAGGNILETLLKRPDFLRRTRAAALAGDDELLWRCLRETLRFRNINPGPWRVVWGAGHTLNRGTDDEVRFEPGMAVLASTQAAMFDPRRVKHPHSFDPDRPDEDYLVFSVGQHWCLGAYIAIAQITQTFKPLLKREGLAALENKLGHMKRFSVFPLHLHVRFESKKS